MNEYKRNTNGNQATREIKQLQGNQSYIKEYLINLFDQARFTRFNNKRETIWEIPCSFDIETSSFYDDGNNQKLSITKDDEEYFKKVSLMYEWTFQIQDLIIYGRYWDEFLDLCDWLVEYGSLSPFFRLVVFVHNLSFEFQFIRNLFYWCKVFSLEERKPIYAITNGGIEFRCSYLLSGYSLDTLAKNLNHHTIKKLVGSLDYDLIRCSNTPLTSEELEYCFNDVTIVVYYIEELMEQYGSLTKLPTTKTGFVRNYCRKKVMQDEFSMRCVHSLTLECDEYKMLKQAFQGGFTHANVYNARELHQDVTSYDFTSSYPSVMLSEMFPMSKGERYDPKSEEDFDKQLGLYCCLFEITFYNIKASQIFENYISKSKCWELENEICNNGRIISADKLSITITEQDFFIINEYYDFDDYGIGAFYRYKKNYLPKPIIECILELYDKKTMLKGIEEKKQEYQNAKEMINSMYGMCVTDIVRDDITYSTCWGSNQQNLNAMLVKYNNSRNRFLSYAWGVWVTAYARRNLFTGISEFKMDYIYSDTDSLKVLNADQHQEYIQKYNEEITKKIERQLQFSKIDYQMPKTIKGVVKPLGVWDYDGHYQYFKSLGAKRYMYVDEDGLHLTISGVNKTVAVPYLIKEYGNNYKKIIDEVFDDGLEFPKGECGKMTHTYIDEERCGTLVDYLGNRFQYYSNGGVHLEQTSYILGLAYDYLMILKNIHFYERKIENFG